MAKMIYVIEVSYPVEMPDEAANVLSEQIQQFVERQAKRIETDMGNANGVKLKVEVHN